LRHQLRDYLSRPYAFFGYALATLVLCQKGKSYVARKGTYGPLIDEPDMYGRFVCMHPTTNAVIVITERVREEARGQY
jgi:hypothetical protein